jgi:tetratricopeptide (TPR) repeat protein
LTFISAGSIIVRQHQEQSGALGMALKSGKTSKTIKRGKRLKVSNKDLAIHVETIEQVRQLAWTGQHAKTIELATQELRRDSIYGVPTVMMDLLDLRAESYIAIGKLDLAAKDANAMVKISQRSKVKGLQAQALNRKALVQMRTGDLNGAVKSATSGVNTKHSSTAIKAMSLFRLSEAQFRTQQNEAAVQNAQKAIDLFQSIGDLSGAGRAYWALANGCDQIRRMDESRRAAQAALELCTQAGDQYGIGNALNAIGLSDVDIVEAIQHRQRAIEAFEKAGFIDRIQTGRGNLALVYQELGLYPHARRLQLEGVDLHRQMGTKVGRAYALANLAGVEIVIGEVEPARAHTEEFNQLASDIGDPAMDVNIESGLGDLKFAEGDTKSAIKFYKSALRIARAAKLARENVVLSELGKIYLADKDPVAALKATTKAADLHRAQSFAKPDGFTSQAIWWRHTQALLANKKTKEAREALDRAYEFLLDGIQNIRDMGLRRNALNKVPENRELLNYWSKDWLKRNGKGASRFAAVMPHLAIESNVREPFKRLADTGLRLNVLKTVNEIQAFLVEEATELSGGERVMLIIERDSKSEVTESILPRGEEAQNILSSVTRYLNQARLTRTTQLIIDQGLGRIVAPLVAQNQVIGYLYVDMDELYGKFDDTDRDMLGMLANQAAVALDNAQWAQGLERKVEERTEELQASNTNLEQRNT